MATLAATHPTLLDVTKRMDPDGKIATIAELLSQTNEILDDMVWIEGNLPTGHRGTIRSGLPTPTWRKLYGGVQPSKSRTVQVTDSCGMLEAYAEVDKALADLNGNTAAFRLSEDRAHIEGMNQEFSSTLFYGNESTEPEAFTGLAPRFNSLSAENGGNIVTGSGLTETAPDGAAENSSIWLIVWGPNTVHGIYPKGSKGGLQMNDKGQVTVENAGEYAGAGAHQGGRYEAYRTHYKWDCGLHVRDWRYIVRIAFNREDLSATAGSGPQIVEMMSKAMRRIPNLNMGRAAFYANRTSFDFLDMQSLTRSTMAFSNVDDAQGKMVTAFRGIPIRRCDAILDTEGSTANGVS
jgi:hypothetical protein